MTKHMPPSSSSAAALVCILLLSACTETLTPQETEAPPSSDIAAETTRWWGTTDCCGEDPHPVHGVITPDGGIVMVGKYAQDRGLGAFALKLRGTSDDPTPQFVQSGDPRMVFATTAAPSGGTEAWLQVAAVGDDLVVVGFTQDGTRAEGVIKRLDGETGTVIWSTRVPSSQQSFLESVAVLPDGRLALGGTTDAPADAMEGFKSFGNVIAGTAWLGILQPDTGEVVEEHRYPGLVSLKSIRAFPTGEVAAISMDDEEQSAVVLIDSEGAENWRKAYSELGELTDVAVHDDPSLGLGLAVTGHGGQDTIDGQLARIELDGSLAWYDAFGNYGQDAEGFEEARWADPRFIFDECWSIQSDPAGNLTVTCGTGIEGCGQDALPDATPQERAACRRDARTTWRAVVASYNGQGQPLWHRAAAFREAPEPPSNSAGEFILRDPDGQLHVVVDQDFGIGWWTLAQP